MIVKDINKLPFFEAGDETILAEVLHPKNDFVDLPFSVAYAKIPEGKASLPHRLESSETYIFTEGEGVIHVDGKTQTVKKGVVVMVPANADQHVVNKGNGDLCFYCLVAPPWSEATEHIENLD